MENIDDKACNLDLNLELGLGGYVLNNPLAKSDLTIDHHDDKEKGTILMKRSILHEEDPDIYEISTDNMINGSRKKLRLTREQSAMLEHTFKLHSTISTAQKRDLAEKLNLKHRQVEVWFQNRRARTKVKQTEVNYTFLKQCSEKLTQENLRLKKELEELRALKVGPSKKASNWITCSSCNKLWNPNEAN